MNKFWKAVLINIGVVYLVSALTLASGQQSTFLLLPIILSVIEFFVGTLLLIFPQTRKAAQIMLAASGIIFLIGLSVCSIVPYSLNMH